MNWAILISDLQKYLAQTQEQLCCLVNDVAELKQSLGYEYGRPSKSIQGHDPIRLPYILKLAATTNPTAVNLEGSLGKRSTRGHIVNLGSNRAILTFYSENPDTKSATTSIQYELPPGATLDLSWAVPYLTINATTDGDSVVQVFAQ